MLPGAPTSARNNVRLRRTSGAQGSARLRPPAPDPQESSFTSFAAKKCRCRVVHSFPDHPALSPCVLRVHSFSDGAPTRLGLTIPSSLPLLLLLLLPLLLQLAGPTSADSVRSNFAVSLGKDRILKGLDINFKDPRLPTVRAFLGVRYASLEKLKTTTTHRFRQAVAPFVVEHIPGLQYKTVMPPVCPQVLPEPEKLRHSRPKHFVDHIRRILPFLKKWDEECLTLNIYTPAKESESLFPIVLFVHGESYEYGSGNAYDPSVLVSYGQIIVITMNYRLGVLGFFATPSGQGAMGNYALQDLQAALAWIQMNIRRFGGDPKQVTLFGHGYGAALVNLFLASNLALGGYGVKRAILLDGSALAPWATSRYFHDFSAKLAASFNCTPTELLARLQVMPVREILNTLEMAPEYRFVTRLGPVVTANLFPGANLRASLDGRPWGRGRRKVVPKFSSVDIMFGITKSAAYDWLKDPGSGVGIPYAEFDRQLRTFVRNNFAYHQQKLYDILSNFYIDWTKMASSNPMEMEHSLLVSWLNLLTDAMYNAPSFEVAMKHAATGRARTFTYIFAHHSNIPGYPQWTSGLHADDLMYIFGAPILRNEGVRPFPKRFLVSDRLLSEAMMRFVSNFIKSGDPNLPLNHTSLFGKHIKNTFVNTRWPKYSTESQNTFYIDQSPHFHNRGVRFYRARQLSLWQRLIPILHKSDGLPATYHRFLNHSNRRLFDPLSAFVAEEAKLSTPSLLAVPPSPLPGEATGTRPAQVAQIDSEATATSRSETTLIWTIVAGCALLALNVLVFMGIYYQVFRQCARTDPVLANQSGQTTPPPPANTYKTRSANNSSGAAYMSLKQREEPQHHRLSPRSGGHGGGGGGHGMGLGPGAAGATSPNTMVSCCTEAVELCPDVARRCQSPGGSVQLTCVDRGRGQPITMV